MQHVKLPYNPKLKGRARELRKARNLPETLLWNKLKNRQFKGYDFDRQRIIGNYIVDFYCANCNIVIEVDGSSHNAKQEYDKNRDDFLNACGLEVIRIADSEVKNNLAGVMAMLSKHSAFRTTSSLRATYFEEETTPSGDNAPATPSHSEGELFLEKNFNSCAEADFIKLRKYQNSPLLSEGVDAKRTG